MNIVTKQNVFNEEKNNDQKEVKLVRKAAIARQILRIGGKDVRIVDIKQDNTDPDHKRSIFAFENSPRFQEIFTNVLAENERAKNRTDEDINAKIESRVKEEMEKFLKKLNEEKE